MGRVSFTRQAPAFELSCEAHGLVYRLAANNQGPRLRVTAEARNLGELPVHNLIGTIPGTQLPNEYVMLSAHFDSWDGGLGAADNATGSVLMLEAMRILKQVYPNPKRTIVVGLWNGEEQGLNGSHAYVEDNPRVVANLHALFNQDNGTGRIVSMSSVGFVDAGESLARRLSKVPAEVTSTISRATRSWWRRWCTSPPRTGSAWAARSGRSSRSAPAGRQARGPSAPGRAEVGGQPPLVV